MAEKKIQENPTQHTEETTESDKSKDMSKAPATLPAPVTVPAPRLSIPSFTKAPPNDLYRRLLPAVLFLLTFVTVMTVLLIYMDTVALGAQQFRVNMSQDYELARIPPRSAALVAYVRQLRVPPRPPRAPGPAQPTDRAPVLGQWLGDTHNGTLVEFLPSGPRDRTALWLESRGWRGLAVRAAPRAFLALRGRVAALHACLSPADHPREVTYHDPETLESSFSSRVLCLPLMTVLLAADATRAHLVLLRSEHALSALKRLPWEDVSLKMLEIFNTDPIKRNMTTEFLATKNYTVAATFPDSVMYALVDKH